MAGGSTGGPSPEYRGATHYPGRRLRRGVGLRLEVPTLTTPDDTARFRGSLDLVRVPLEDDPTLRAWDAADELLLDWAEGQVVGGPGFPPPTPVSLAETAVIGDRFGALTVGLLTSAGVGAAAVTAGDQALRVYDDSMLTKRAIETNTHSAQLPTAAWRFSPIGELADLPRASVGQVLFKVPKSRGALEGFLHELRPALTPAARVVGGGMTRQIHRSTLDLLASIIGPTVTSHARRKARLTHTQLDPRMDVAPTPWPRSWQHDGLTMYSHPGVFSAEALDQGTRALLEAFPDLVSGRTFDGATAIDLGCGNGIVGTVLARHCPGLTLEFRDMSFNALRSAAETFSTNFPGRPARFVAGDGVEDRNQDSVELVVCNPPFHARGARGDHTAWTMFSGARRALRDGGELWVVGNRHLGYAVKLKRLFESVEVVGSDPKFVVVRARVGG